MNIDADVIRADWLRVAAWMRVTAAIHPELTEIEVRVEAEPAHLGSLRRSVTSA